MVELEDMKSKGPVEATFWPGIKVGNIHIRLRGVGHCMHGRYKSSLGCGRGMNLLCSVTCMSAYTLTVSHTPIPNTEYHACNGPHPLSICMRLL